MQTNYTADSDVPNGSNNTSRIIDACNKISANNMGLEVELSTGRTGSCTDVQTIMSYGLNKGLMNGYNVYYTCGGPKLISEICTSDDSNIRLTYDMFHKYIKGTLTASDFQ